MKTALLTDTINSPITWAIVGGLVIGKLLGISLMTWISIRTGLGRLPDGVSISHLFGVAMLGGMGLTMSIFIAGLSFSASELDMAKIAVLCASAIAGISGYLWLRYIPGQ